MSSSQVYLSGCSTVEPCAWAGIAPRPSAAEAVSNANMAVFAGAQDILEDAPFVEAIVLLRDAEEAASDARNPRAPGGSQLSHPGFVAVHGVGRLSKREGE